MLEAISETVDHGDPAVVVIRQTKVIDGVDLSGVLPVDRDNVEWLKQALVHVIATPFEEPELARGNDALLVFIGGHDASPVVNVHNRRKEGGPHAGIFARAFPVPHLPQIISDLG